MHETTLPTGNFQSSGEDRRVPGGFQNTKCSGTGGNLGRPLYYAATDIRPDVGVGTCFVRLFLFSPIVFQAP